MDDALSAGSNFVLFKYTSNILPNRFSKCKKVLRVVNVDGEPAASVAEEKQVVLISLLNY